MSKYVEKNLINNEVIVKKAKFSKINITFKMIGGILFFWLLFIPLVKSIISLVKFNNRELAITNKRVIAKKVFLTQKSFLHNLIKFKISQLLKIFGVKFLNILQLI